MKQKGQIALIALLVLTVAATVSLSLVARTTTDISVSRNIENSTRAFSAAEAGIEETLKSGVGSAGTIDSSLGITYSVTPVPVGGDAATPFVFPQKTAQEHTETVWLVDHDASGNIIESRKYIQPTMTVCWSNESPTTPAIVVTVLYKRASDSTYQVAKVASDPISSRAPDPSNNFSTSAAGGCGAGSNTTYHTTINFSSLSINMANDILIAVRIRTLYNRTQLAITPAQALPSQGVRIESVGSAGGGVNRKIVVYQQYRETDSVFDYGVYSEGSL